MQDSSRQWVTNLSFWCTFGDYSLNVTLGDVLLEALWLQFLLHEHVMFVDILVFY